MSEMVWCNIKVKVPSTWNRPGDESPLFMEAFNLGDLQNDENGEDWSIWGVQGDGNYGLQDDDVLTALNLLHEHQVPYVAIEDAKYEWLGQYDWFNGFEERSSEYAGENIVLPESTFRGWLNGLEYDDYEGLVDKLHAFFDVGNPPLSEISIAHLPAVNPIDIEEE